MRILITGGAGYIGSVLTELLLHQSHEVTVIDNFMWRQTPFGHLFRYNNFHVVRGDARDMRLMRRALQTADVLIPLAALVGAPLCEARPNDAQSTNVDAIVSSMQFMSPDQRIVIPISNSGYGVGEKDAYCTEDSPLRPVSLYGQTKVAAEKAALDRGSAISLRLATVFGMSSRMRLDLLVNDFTWRALRDRSLVIFEGHFRRNFVHVRDVALAFGHVIDRWEDMIGTPIYNVGDTQANMTKLDLCKVIQQEVSGFVWAAGDGKDPDMRDYVVSNSRFEGTGWHPAWTLREGIRELVRGYSMFNVYEHGNI